MKIRNDNLYLCGQLKTRNDAIYIFIYLNKSKFDKFCVACKRNKLETKTGLVVRSDFIRHQKNLFALKC